ncbi:hypothetical protein, partial [Xenophilus sp.]|uniref:hypothetical protein n=1 Tax=Xenophilus sp. TaxID=1873499 RepID=UPI0037DD55F1
MSCSCEMHRPQDDRAAPDLNMPDGPGGNKLLTAWRRSAGRLGGQGRRAAHGAVEQRRGHQRAR